MLKLTLAATDTVVLVQETSILTVVPDALGSKLLLLDAAATTVVVHETPSVIYKLQAMSKDEAYNSEE